MSEVHSLKKPCLRCLIRDIPDEKELHRILLERIEQLPPEERASDELVSLRLARCLECPSLNHGTCTECGCYVELRSARLNKGCPHVPSRWEK